MAHRILIVDDEPDLEILIRQKFRKQVVQKKYEFVSAYNGVEALEILQQNQEIDLVLTDINMPRMDGLTLLKKIRELNNPALKAIVISAYGDMENIRTAMNQGAFDFVTKPIDFTDLEVTIHKTLEEVLEIRQALEAHHLYIAMQKELAIARNIQMAILPDHQTFGLDDQKIHLAAKIIPAKEVGGDFYDFFWIDENRLGFCIGDVSGKGIPAAIFMAVCKTALKTFAVKGASPDECLSTINNTMFRESPSNLFVTAFYGILDIRNGEMEYGNAGHNPTFLVNNAGEVQPLPQVNGIPLGCVKDYLYDKQKIKMEKGELLFLYTDGVDEAMNKDDNEFSEKRLKKHLKALAGESVSDLNRRMIDQVQLFTGGVEQSDDITMLSLRYVP